ncbi:MAG: hypothetical protein Q8Q07_06850, partial [Dehalococcoidales bacterium]|nr:hypothetical protein [Dehalococcoidales bacterium]
ISEPDKGPGHAFSKGMLLARGKYLKHLPDDDVVYPAAMEQAIRVMEEHPEIDLLVCGGTREFGGKVKPVWLPPGTNYGYSPRDIFKYGASGIGFVIRRSALPLVGLFPVSLADDVDFAINVIKRGGTVKFCRINLFHHPIYEHSAVIRNLKAHRRHKYSLVRQYSLSYYYWYRLERFLKRRALYNLAVLAFKPSYVASFLRREGVMAALRRVLMLLTGKKHPESTAGVEEPVWDGGFS